MLNDIFPDFSSTFWKDLDPMILDQEDIVSKMHSIELLEQLSPYRGATEPYFRRVWRALDQLQAFGINKEWLTAALVIFGNVIYLPEALLEDAWRSLYLDLAEEVQPPQQKNKNWWSAVHVLENDPSGMTASFFHLNKIEGRLDHEKILRVDSTDKLADLILDLLNPLKQESATKTIRALLQRQTWAVLVDKSLSGHSLSSDLERIVQFQTLVRRVGTAPPRISILCQVMTDKAVRSVTDTIDSAHTDIEASGLPKISINRAVYLDDSYKITTPNNNLLVNPAISPYINELCGWFAKTFLDKSPAFSRMLARSGGDLAFGYRGCGLTLVDYQNCPTDSLPLLWHTTTDDTYTSPYPRIHSRIGGQISEPSADKWEQIKASPEVERALKSSLAAG